MSKLVAKHSEILGDTSGPIYSFPALIDLNGDNNPEFINRVGGPTTSGIGGCSSLVLTQQGEGLELMTRISATRLPVVIVHVSDGGILPGYRCLLRFDGSSYR